VNERKKGESEVEIEKERENEDKTCHIQESSMIKSVIDFTCPPINTHLKPHQINYFSFPGSLFQKTNPTVF
jgi:hypothetical protein